MSEITVKGVFILQTLKMLRQRLTPEQFADFERRLGVDFKDLNLSYFRNYPVELQNKVEEEAARVLWGRTDDDVFFEFGRMSFQTLTESAIGRTLFALVGRNPKKMALSSQRVMSAITEGMQIEVEDRGPTCVSFRFRNNPYRVPGWQGVCDAFMNYAGVQPRIDVVRHGGLDTEYIIEWDEPERSSGG